MICPKCNQPKDTGDFYWMKLPKGFIPQLRYKECKKCISEINKIKLKEKNDYLKEFFI